MAVLALLAVACSAVTLFVFAHVRAVVRTIATDAEPSVVAAQILRAQLAAMDAEALANSLNDNAGAAGTSAAFREYLQATNGELVVASRNITTARPRRGRSAR